jgi:hypothetical protein
MPARLWLHKMPSQLPHFVTPEPNVLLKKWRARDTRMFNETRGAGGIDRFIEAPRPIRIWYNTDFGGADGMPLSPEAGPTRLAPKLKLQLSEGRTWSRVGLADSRPKI